MNQGDITRMLSILLILAPNMLAFPANVYLIILQLKKPNVAGATLPLEACPGSIAFQYEEYYLGICMQKQSGKKALSLEFLITVGCGIFAIGYCMLLYVTEFSLQYTIKDEILYSSKQLLKLDLKCWQCIF